MRKKAKETDKKAKIQIKSTLGNLLFEHASETIKDALIIAVSKGADLRGANLRGAIGLYSIVPEEGSFIGFKKLADGTIVKLLTPEEAERVGGYTGRKCRAEKAIVIEGAGYSNFNSTFEYKPGVVVTPDKWDNDPRVECSHGIHFFLTRKEAENF